MPEWGAALAAVGGALLVLAITVLWVAWRLRNVPVEFIEQELERMKRERARR